MLIFFLICLVGVVAVVPLHFLSVEHLKLEEKYGQAKGKRIGEFLSLFSGWGFFLFWAGLWFSPQPRFIISLFSNLSVVFPFVNLSIPVVHLIVFVLLFLSGAWLGIAGVRGTTLKVAETHRANEIITSGVYSVVRHPQYLGGLLAHVGVTFLFSACLRYKTNGLGDSLFSVEPLIYALQRFLRSRPIREVSQLF